MLVYFKGNGVWENAEDVTNVVNGKFSDGEYCYTVVDGVITSKDTCAPANAILNVYYQAGSYGAYLDVALTANVTVYSSSTYVQGYSDNSCSIPNDNDTSSANLVITAGNTSTTESGNNMMGCFNLRYEFTGQLDVNGTSVADGGSLSIGGTTVTVYYPSVCTVYDC